MNQYYAGVPLKRIGRELDLNTFWSKFAQNQKHIAYTEGIAIALLIVGGIVGLGGFRSASLFCLVIAILPLTLFAVYSFSPGNAKHARTGWMLWSGH